MSGSQMINGFPSPQNETLLLTTSLKVHYFITWYLSFLLKTHHSTSQIQNPLT